MKFSPFLPPTSSVANATARSMEVGIAQSNQHQDLQVQAEPKQPEISGRGQTEPVRGDRSKHPTLQAKAKKILRKNTEGPYPSSHGIHGVELNGSVSVSRSQQPTSGGTVWCRHLATSFVLAKDKADFVRSVSSTKGIQNLYKNKKKLNEINAKYYEMVRNAQPDNKQVLAGC